MLVKICHIVSHQWHREEATGRHISGQWVVPYCMVRSWRWKQLPQTTRDIFRVRDSSMVPVSVLSLVPLVNHARFAQRLFCLVPSLFCVCSKISAWHWSCRPRFGFCRNNHSFPSCFSFGHTWGLAMMKWALGIGGWNMAPSTEDSVWRVWLMNKQKTIYSCCIKEVDVPRRDTEEIF